MTLTSILSQRRPAAILAATGIASLAVFLARPAVAHAAGIEDETAFVFNTFSFLVWGVVVIGAFVFVVSFALWKLLDKILGVRVSHQVERLGQDAGELGMESYPEFVLMPEPDDED